MKSRLAKVGFWLALLSATALLLSPIGYRLGWWDLSVALSYLVLGGLIAAAAALLLSLIAALRTRPGTARQGFGLALAGIVISVGFSSLPLMQIIKARSLPPIHDITTDTGNPPVFVALAAARQAAPNGLEYRGAEIASQQQQAYPAVVPYEAALSPDQLFSRVEKIAGESGWEIAAAVPDEGRIEATDTTLLYNFKDDIVIRITPTEQGSRLDIRSMSRIGVSDIGKNAARIQTFLEQLNANGG